MFDPRITGNANEHITKLRQEAHHVRLVRGTTSRFAQFAARTFRTWANRLEDSDRNEQSAISWRLEAPGNEPQLAG